MDGKKLYNHQELQKKYLMKFNIHSQDFPGGIVVKNPPANAGDVDSIPGAGRSHMPGSN